MNAIADLDDRQHSIINLRLREALAECMALPHSGVIALCPGREDWCLYWLAGPTARLAGRIAAGYDFAASLAVIAADYARSDQATVPDLVGVGTLATAPGNGKGLTGFATVVAGTRVHTVQWAAGAAKPTWRIQAAASAKGDVPAGLASLLSALCAKEAS